MKLTLQTSRHTSRTQVKFHINQKSGEEYTFRHDTAQRIANLNYVALSDFTEPRKYLKKNEDPALKQVKQKKE